MRKSYILAKTFKNGNKVEHQCNECGKSFWITQSRHLKNEGKFCSRQCFNIYIRKTYRGKYHPAWKGGGISRICDTCGKKFITKPNSIKRGFGKYCSHRCAIIPKNIHRKQKDTDIERLIEDALINRKIPFTKQVPLLNITIVDFLLPKDIVVYCDGDYWHGLPERIKTDKKQTKILLSAGYKVFRFSGKQIKQSPLKCVDALNYWNEDK